MLTEHEVPLLKALGAAPFKITLPAPSNFVPTGFKPGVTDRHYKDRDALLADLVAIVRDEVQWLVGAGRHATSSSTRRSTRTTSIRSTARRCGSRAAIRTRTSRPRPPATTRRWRVCRARMSRSPCTSAAGTAAAGGTRKAATTRSRRSCSRGWTSIGSCSSTTPSGRARSSRCAWCRAARTSCSGLVTTKEPRLESGDDLRRRIDEAARYVPLEHLALSPQCGFASIAVRQPAVDGRPVAQAGARRQDGARRVGHVRKLRSSKWKVEKYRAFSTFHFELLYFLRVATGDA